MAVASATLAPPTLAAASATVAPKRMKTKKVKYITGFNPYTGLKAHNCVTALGLPLSADQSFAKLATSLKAPASGKRIGGGSLAATCNAAAEIFKIAAIMNGLVLVGVAVGFVLLRIEASVEEAEP